ncbi:MAG: hypothetical protein J4432_02015 [DPANN group archaeon]|nr:hypothetical protein [DPANN group archaeon]
MRILSTLQYKCICWKYVVQPPDSHKRNWRKDSDNSKEAITALRADLLKSIHATPEIEQALDEVIREIFYDHMGPENGAAEAFFSGTICKPVLGTPV